MEEEQPKKETKRVGLVMPISDMSDFPEKHWADIRKILEGFLSKISKYDFECEMVSYSKEVNLIQGNIVKNLYESDLVICDISGLNPNVMFELGIRLAFDKPVIIVKDKETDYPFDIRPLEYISYSRDLGYMEVLEFEKKFLSKVEATINEYNTNPNYSTFLKYFGNYKAMSLDKQYEFIDVMNSNIITILDKVSYMQKNIESLNELNQVEKNLKSKLSPITDNKPILIQNNRREIIGFIDGNERKTLGVGDRVLVYDKKIANALLKRDGIVEIPQ